MKSEYDPVKRRQYYLNNREADIAKNKEWRLNNLDKYKEIAKTYHAKDKLINPIKYLLKDAKARAKKKQLPFNLTIEDIIIPEVCPIFNVPLVFGDPKYCPSIDRIIPSLGYIKENIQIMSALANKMKWDASTDELRAFCEGYLRLLKEGT